MKKSTKNIIIGTGIVAASAAVVGTIYHAVAKSLMNIALDRKMPKAVTKNMNRGRDIIMGSGELSAVLEKIMDEGARLEEMPHEDVEIESYDGVKLVGHWYPCEGAKRIVIAMHGWRSSWSQDFGIIAPSWFEAGCSVLFCEQRGQGESGGEYMGFGLLERYDCLEWIKWACEKTDGEDTPIYLGGVSMGGATVLMTAGFDLPERVHGIVADCAFTSPHAIWKHVVQNNLHIPYGLYSTVASDICKKKIQMSSKEYSCTDAMKVCRVPVLFIHGTDDRFVPVSMTYENYKACIAPRHLLVVPGADHGLSYFTDKKSYEEAVTKFWNDYDEAIPEAIIPSEEAEKETIENK